MLQYLIRHLGIDTSTAARICQRQESEVRGILSQVDRQYPHIERGGTSRGTYSVLKQRAEHGETRPHQQGNTSDRPLIVMPDGTLI